jgi:[ribosomal protein S18]-alanine N-acetyltransferase
MRISLATIKDIKNISDLEYGSNYRWRGSKKEELKRVEDLFSKGYCEIYILRDKSPAGYFAISFDKKKKICYLNYFAVSKKFQGRGFAKLMMKKIISIAKRNKCKSIELAVWAKNFSAIGLYNKFGFRFTEIKKNYYPNKDDKVRMILEF